MLISFWDDQGPTEWVWAGWRGIVKFEYADELRKPSLFGLDGEKWAGLRDDLVGSLKTPIEKIQESHMEQRGIRSKVWTDESWEVFYANRLVMQERWWQNILHLLADQSLESFGNPDILIEASVTVESLERGRIRCVTAYRIKRGKINGAGDDSGRYLLHCTVVFGFERKPVSAYLSRQQRVDLLERTLSDGSEESSADGDSATPTGGSENHTANSQTDFSEIDGFFHLHSG